MIYSFTKSLQHLTKNFHFVLVPNFNPQKTINTFLFFVMLKLIMKIKLSNSIYFYFIGEGYFFLPFQPTPCYLISFTCCSFFLFNSLLIFQVSWIRRKDYHLLTVGLTTYSSDDRFQAIHLQHSEVSATKIFST